MIEKVMRYMEQYQMLALNDTVAAGISGGADSVCLLFVLKEIQKKIPFRLLVVHVNHGIREEAYKDETYVKGLCEQWNLPFFAIHADVEKLAKEQGISTEEAGRNVRYASFEEILQKEAPKAWAAPAEQMQGRAKIAVAHNQNDRAETMLFNLFRGTGIKGLGSIQPVRGRIIRPLLCAERAEIEAFLAKENLSYCIDRTNEEDTYTRNKIRNHIFPYVTSEIAPAAVARMNHSAELFSEVERYLLRESEKACERVLLSRKEGKLQLSVSALLKEDVFLQNQILLLMLAELSPGRKDITSAHVHAVQSLLSMSGSKQADLPYQLCARKEYDVLTLFFKKEETDTSGKQEECPEITKIPGTYRVDGLGELEFSLFSYEKNKQIPQNEYTKWFDYDKIKNRLCIRKRRTGDYLTINEALSRKRLKDYMIQEKIPKAERYDIWLLAEESHILWVIGGRISAQYKIGPNTKHILQVQLKGGSPWQNT